MHHPGRARRRPTDPSAGHDDLVRGPTDHAAAHCLLDALTSETPGIVRARHPQNGATTVAVALHGSTASLRVENASRGTLHVVFDETQLPELIMHLEDGAAWLPR